MVYEHMHVPVWVRAAILTERIRTAETHKVVNYTETHIFSNHTFWKMLSTIKKIHYAWCGTASLLPAEQDLDQAVFKKSMSSLKALAPLRREGKKK